VGSSVHVTDVKLSYNAGNFLINRATVTSLEACAVYSSLIYTLALNISAISFSERR
jgi:hypothetical protein